jgi:hypothetical protein
MDRAWLVLARGWPKEPGSPLIGNNLVFYGAVGAAVLVLLLFILWLRRRPAKHDPEAGMSEELADYPPPPQAAGRQLTLQGRPVRVRLVVVAPVGRQQVAKDGAIEPILDGVVRGLGAVTQQDKARVRLWPLGMSNVGFTPAFFRRVRRPEPAGSPSHWILMAGPARAGAQQILLGLALLADEPNTVGNVAVQPDGWHELLSLE